MALTRNRNFHGKARPTGEPHPADQLSDLYSKGRTPLTRTRALQHPPSGANVHGAKPPPQVLRTKAQDPAVQTQRFPFGGGTTPGSGGRAPSEPAEPHMPHGFDPTKV